MFIALVGVLRAAAFRQPKNFDSNTTSKVCALVLMKVTVAAAPVNRLLSSPFQHLNIPRLLGKADFYLTLIILFFHYVGNLFIDMSGQRDLVGTRFPDAFRFCMQL